MKNRRLLLLGLGLVALVALGATVWVIRSGHFAMPRRRGRRPSSQAQHDVEQQRVGPPAVPRSTSAPAPSAMQRQPVQDG